MLFKQKILTGICFSLIATFGALAETPQPRPTDWAAPVDGAAVKNCFKVSDDIYRSAQPAGETAAAMKEMGIKSILNLRHYHPEDSEEFKKTGIILYSYKMDAGSASIKDLTEVLKIIQNAPKPILIHCHYGSDRTGFIIAGYRMVIMGWTAEKAIEELRKGGYGYHELEFPHIMKELREMDVQAVRNAVIKPQ